MTRVALTALARTATPTPDHVADLLDQFPLLVGAVWEYSVQVTYASGFTDEGLVLSTWKGRVVQEITERHSRTTGIELSVAEQVRPRPPEQVWLQDSSFSYLVANNAVTWYGQNIYQWPLTENAHWPAFPDDYPYIDYEWVVLGREDARTPLREYEDCYVLMLVTGPDSTVRWFYPGVGIVMEDYWHHGEPQDMHWELVRFEAGSP